MVHPCAPCASASAKTVSASTAGSLTFTTLIALVPLVTVMLAVFTAFPMFGGFERALDNYFLQNLVPDGIARPVLRFADRSSPPRRAAWARSGLLLLVVTALALVLTIDRTLNGIWRVRSRGRSRSASWSTGRR